jgi:hypothetical protein
MGWRIFRAQAARFSRSNPDIDAMPNRRIVVIVDGTVRSAGVGSRPNMAIWTPPGDQRER